MCCMFCDRELADPSTGWAVVERLRVVDRTRKTALVDGVPEKLV